MRVLEALILRQLGRGPTHGRLFRCVVVAVEALQLLLRLEQLEEIGDVIVVRLDLAGTASFPFV